MLLVWRLAVLAPGGGWIPPGDLGRFRLAAWGPSQAEILLIFVVLCVV